MNDQNTNTSRTTETPTPSIPTPISPQPVVKTRLVDRISSKIPPKVKDFFNKFYSNKKIFLPVSIALGLLFLTLLIGLLFGSGGKKPQVVKATPTPELQEITPQESTSSSETKLEKLKGQVQDLDVNQKRLQPPAVNFEIKF